MNSSKNCPVRAAERSRLIAALLSLLVAAASSADDMLWLEREWISDADATIAANPSLVDADEVTQGKWKSIYGHMHWRFSNGLLEVTRPDAEPFSNTYSVRQLDGERFEILVDDPNLATTFEISRTSRGFCSELQFYPPEPKAPGFPYTECFKPFNDLQGN